MNDNNQPRVLIMRTSQGTAEVCSICRNPIAPPHPYQDASNRYWRKKECAQCKVTLELDGPYKNADSVGVVAFK